MEASWSPLKSTVAPGMPPLAGAAEQTMFPADTRLASYLKGSVAKTIQIDGRVVAVRTTI
ncbi:hypothetical protein [Paraburkholderia sacchari]|uniref:hypothetical protein n=1 Tax=Paraburkholderia sacchari TaxID=159450 RepID=UPI001269FB52|nr:hypothetical protein [Paraburkholderia sacchari]